MRKVKIEQLHRATVSQEDIYELDDTSFDELVAKPRHEREEFVLDKGRLVTSDTEVSDLHETFDVTVSWEK